jgi:hypothetical protein
MSQNKPTSYNEEDLRFENELRKLKLRAEFGMKLHAHPTASLPQENVWLQQLEDFERQYADYNQQPVFVYLNNPQDFLPPSQLHREEIPAQLKRLRRFLKAHNILVESRCEVPAREMYRFILEEVFFEEVPKSRSAEYPRRFVYEDFHPNAVYDIKTSLEDFFHKTFQQFWVLLEGQFCERIQTTRRSSLSRADLIEQLKDWVNDYEDIQLTDIQFEKIEVRGEEAQASLHLSFEAMLPRSYETVHQTLFANFQLQNEDWSLWRISGLFLPFL